MNNSIGKFEVIESFAIKKRNQFYLLGKLVEGDIKENWFINVGFNQSTFVSFKIDSVEKIELASEDEEHLLLIVNCDEEMIELLLILKIGLESIFISIEE